MVSAMILFVMKMYELIKMRASDIGSNRRGSRAAFNDQQKQLLMVTTKYVSLLAFAIISTWVRLLAFIAEVIYDDISTISGILGNVDNIINILCLYLQYPFAKKYYDKYCICAYLGKCCIYCLTTKDIPELQELESQTQRGIDILFTSSCQLVN